MAFEKVTIVGVGLIGGSFALALKDRQLARKIIGVSRSAASPYSWSIRSFLWRRLFSRVI